MSFSVVVLVARFALVGMLYLFLFVVVRGLYRDLRAAGQPRASGSAAQPAVGPAHLLVIASGKTPYAAGKAFRLRSPTVLGRDPQCDIPVEDDFVSGQHLRLVQGTRGWQAQDLNSTNGTRLNSTRIRGTVLLKHGDILDLGRFRVRFGIDR